MPSSAITLALRALRSLLSLENAIASVRQPKSLLAQRWVQDMSAGRPVCGRGKSFGVYEGPIGIAEVTRFDATNGLLITYGTPLVMATS